MKATILALVFLLAGSARAGEESEIVGGARLEPYRVAEVGAAAPGFVKRVAVRIGEKVKRGQLLAELDSREAELELRMAGARLAAQEIVVERARILARSLKARAAGVRDAEAAELTAPGASVDATREADAAALDLKLAEAEAELVRIELEAAEGRLAQRTVVSPMDGVVTEIRLGAGRFVPEPGYPIVQLARLDRLKAVMHVDAKMHRALAVGSVFQAIDSRDREFRVTLESFVPELDAGDRDPVLRVTVWLDSPPDRPLFPGHQLWLRLPATGDDDE